MAAEIDHLMSATLEGVSTFSGSNAKIARVAEWLDTPKGQIWGAPNWGHELMGYKHSPLSDTTAAAIRNSIILKLTADIPDVAVSAINVEAEGMDLWRIKIHLSGISTAVEREVNL